MRDLARRGLRSSLALLLVLAAPASLCFAAPRVSKGTFTDAAGAKHVWQVSPAHALIWDGSPYLPVGGTFEVASWAASGAGEGAWDGDVAALAKLKERGVTDLCLRARGGGPLTEVRPEAVQRLIDHLDAQGFTYGLSLGDGIRQPLIAYDVRPGAYRSPGPAGGGLVRIAVEDMGSAVYVVAHAERSEVLEAGEADRVADGARVRAPAVPGGAVVFLVPERIWLPDTAVGGVGLPNLWDGFDDYRDALLALFGNVKLGKGFRFFVDPLGARLALDERSRSLVPTGKGFQEAWAAWLTRRYRNIEALHTAWRMPERNLVEVREAARLVPLWSGDKGSRAFFDRATGKHYPVGFDGSVAPPAFWSDLEAFKLETVRGYVNALTDVLKRGVADVPVVYRWTGYSPLWTQTQAQGGFDALGIEAAGSGSDLVTRSAGYTYAQAAEAARTIWLPVTGTAYADAAGKPGAYPSRAGLFADFDWLREVGAKGFFVTDLRRVSAASAGDAGLVAQPDQLDWLRAYKGMLLAAAGMAEQQPRDRVVFYPRSSAVLASLRPLTGGRWWLPTDQPAQTFDFGPAGRAYSLSDETGTVFYLWNPSGPRQIRLKLPPIPKGFTPPPVLTSDPKASSRRGVLTLNIGPEPVSVRNLAALPVPLEAFPELANEAEKLARLARQRNDLNAGRLGQQLAFLRARYKDEAPYAAFQSLSDLTAVLRLMVRPYLWLEAEAPQAHTFDENRERRGASNGRVLAVGPRPTTSPAGATYPFDVAEDGVYSLWVAASGGASLTVRVDTETIGGGLTPAGASFADGLVWAKAGDVNLTKGRHVLDVSADGPAVIDALLLTRGAFAPDGPNPPPIPLDSAGTDDKKK